MFFNCICFLDSSPNFLISLFSGTGICCIETCQLFIMSDYFFEKKELASSLRVSGSSLGAIVFPFLLVQLFENFSMKLSCVILSGIFIIVIILVLLIRPYEVHQNIVYNRKKKMFPDTKLKSMALEVRRVNQSTVEKRKKFDIKLFTNPLYITHIFMIICVTFALPQFQYFLSRFGEFVGLSPKENSVTLAVQAVSDFVFRLLIGFLLNKNFFKKTHCLIMW